MHEEEADPWLAESERDLIGRAKKDTEAFGLLYDRYFQQIHRYVMSRLGDRSLAEDRKRGEFPEDR